MTAKGADWPGVGNGEQTPIEVKKLARHGRDIPEVVQREFARVADIEPAMLAVMWQAGLVDLEVEGGKPLISMTVAQGTAWRETARAEMDQRFGYTEGTE